LKLIPCGVLLVVSLCVGAPIAMLFYGASRSAAPGAPGYFTWNNFAAVYGTAPYQAALLNTILLAATVAAFSVLLGAVLAWMVARTDIPGRQTLSLLLIVPLMVSNLITALAWVVLAAPNAGFLNMLARQALGIRVLFSIYSFPGIVLVFVLHYASFAFLPISAALQSIDSTLEEASAILGGGPLHTAMHMTLPLIFPALAATFLLVFVFTAENFSVPMLLGSTVGFQTLASWIYVEMSGEPSAPTLGAAAGTMLLWIALAGTFLQRRIMRRASHYVTIGGKGARHGRIALGCWRVPAACLVWFYLFLAVGLPYVTLVLASLLKFVTPRITAGSFTLANYEKLFSGDTVRPIGNSLLLAGAGGLAATLVYFYLAHLIRTLPGRAVALSDHLVMIPTVIPALVLGVGFVWLFVALPLPIYGTIWALLIGYLVRFAGLGVGQSRSAFAQVSGDLTDAARILGAGGWRRFVDITLPLLRPAMVSLWTTLFILIFMEISVTIMLYTPDSMTLSVLLWSRMSNGYQTQAFAVAVLQASIVFAVLAVARTLKTMGE
jgi:iron(III) transport system permease protein